MARSQRRVYSFGNGKADGRGDQKELLGGKGAGLAEMTRIGLPVPPGFTISTDACAEFHQRGNKWPSGLEKQVRQMISKLERASRRKFGDPKRPLLVSVRSGASRSMPGMMETILNLGLNDATLNGLAGASGNRRFALDAYRRLIMMYAAIAKHVERRLFDEAFDEIKRTHTRPRLNRSSGESVSDTDVNAEELETLIQQFKDIYRGHTGEDFPQNPIDQLKGAIDAVFNSWMAEKAVTYRRVENITGLNGTAVNVCQMVFGNMGDDSGTGVCFTRDPSTGENTFYGDLLINAQGEDVVAGVRTPIPLDRLRTLMPEAYEQLEAVRVILEVHYKDMQDLEFTIEQGKLYMLQCRAGKRSPQAVFKIAVDQATQGLLSRAEAGRLAKKKYLPRRYVNLASKPVITRNEAIQRISAIDIERLFYPVLNPDFSADELASRKLGEGIGAVPGAACGEIVFSAQEAELRAKDGASVILVRKETSPEDVGGMHAAAGILTATGGKTSHAAVVARGWGKCCIVGCDELSIDYPNKQMSVNGRVLRQGESITLDGNTGSVFSGEIPLVRPPSPPEFGTLLEWCDDRRRLRVRANADTPADAVRAIELGAEGIGLCRTEHMFFDSGEAGLNRATPGSQPQRIRVMREMILAYDPAARRAARAKQLPNHVDDFVGILRALKGHPVTIRLLDPPLHEFLPQRDNAEGAQAVADELNTPLREELSRISPWYTEERRAIEARMVSVEEIHRRVDGMHEANPMLGHRGCRLCITFPEILDMQVTAIIEAALRCTDEGLAVLPEIMIPLSIDPAELQLLVDRTRQVADRIIARHGAKLKYLVGTMVETPRAALLAEEMAESAEFFSFGTNDLTQLTMGLSRDDAGRFLPDYLSVPSVATAPLFAPELAHTETFESAPRIDRNEFGLPISPAPSHGNATSGDRAAAPVSPDSQPESSAQSPLGTTADPIFRDDPFQSIDIAGVGLLMNLACEQGRSTRSDLKLGICGEHGGDPASVRFCEAIGLDYVSCSPLRVPVARLAAAQAVIANDTRSTRPSKSGRGGRKAKPRAASPSRAKKARPKAKSAAGKKSRLPGKPAVKKSAGKKTAGKSKAGKKAARASVKKSGKKKARKKAGGRGKILAAGEAGLNRAMPGRSVGIPRTGRKSRKRALTGV